VITDFNKAMSVLSTGEIEFILIGGVAGSLHGSAFITQDLDLVYARNRENIRRLAATLQPHQPYLRNAPPGLPFKWDEATIRNGLNFTLTTSFGDLDLLGEVAGGGTYADLLPHSSEVTGFGVTFRLINLDKLIVLKRAAGRPKDLQVIAELRGILQRQRNQPPGAP
jgi:predicted nucleotidyltransferase